MEIVKIMKSVINEFVKNNIMEKENTTHQSFGLARFSRVNGLSNFFGSELEQDNYITFELTEAEVERSLSRERYYGRNRLVKFRMTSSQFAELITSLNIGSGVPCTIEYLPDNRIDKLPEIESRKSFVHRKFKDRMQEFADRVKNMQQNAITITKKKTLSKADVAILTNHLEYLTTEITNNIPFFIECFQETADKVVEEAKMEIENVIMHKITLAGVESLGLENNLLKSGD